jgi:hypothetical protein
MEKKCMENVISYSCQEDTVVDALKRASQKIDPEVANKICGFQIERRTRHGNHGQTVNFLTEIPEDLRLVARSWDFKTVLFEGPLVLNSFIKFSSRHFCAKVPNIDSFLIEWERALDGWIEEQNITIYQALLLHPVLSVDCIKDEDGLIKMRMKFALKEKVHPQLWNLKIVS